MPLKLSRCYLYPLLFILSCFFSLSTYARSPYLVGAGIYDITGPAAEIDMMGYAMPEQTTNGIHSRLWSRAFIVVDRQTSQRVVFVSADLGMIFQSVKHGVVQRLKPLFGDKYNDKNVLLSATHTHSGPGGYAFHTLFNFTVRGFYKPNYDAVVDGIVASIVKADKHLEPGNITIAEGQLTNASHNRSAAAYQKNPVEERERFAHNTDNSMTVLTFTNEQGKPLGMVNWFAVHGVSMSNTNQLISGDNKGYAAYLFEQHFSANYLDDKPFVAAFAQANEGDSSPNIFDDKATGHCDNFACNDIKHTFIIGERQYVKALSLYHAASEPVTGSVDYRHSYIDMTHASVMTDSPVEGLKHTCKAALGYAFGAGTSDGPGPDIFKQGQLESDPLVNLLGNVIVKPTKDMQQCQLPKPILLAVGLNKPHAWVPQHMPVQLLKIGQLVIIGGPGEFTTMAGRRIKAAVKKALSPEVTHVVFAGLANSYAGYVVTPEEYRQQNYEGGFTVFGQWTMPAYLQAMLRLSRDLKLHQPSATGPLPDDLSSNTGSLIPPVMFDDKPAFFKFGHVHTEPARLYKKGQVVEAVFWGGNPRNHFETMQGFLQVQKKVAGAWQTLYHDWDWNTIYRWERIGMAYSFIHIYWQTDEKEAAGEYRLVHDGHYRYGWNHKIYSYTGHSRSFILQG